jgi:hypothetical protein
MKNLAQFLSHVLLAFYIIVGPIFGFEDLNNESNTTPYYQSTWNDFYEVNQTTPPKDDSSTPTEVHSQLASPYQFFPCLDAAFKSGDYSLIPEHIDFSEHDLNIMRDYVQQTNLLAPAAPKESNSNSRWADSTAPWNNLFDELWMHIFECSYFDKRSQRQRHISYCVGSVSKNVERIRRGVRSLKVTLQSRDDMNYYLTAPQNMFLCVNIAHSVLLSKLAKLANLTSGLYELSLLNIDDLNRKIRRPDWVPLLSKLQRLSIRHSFDAAGKHLGFTPLGTKRLCQLVTISTLRDLEFDCFTFNNIKLGSDQKLTHVSTLIIDNLHAETLNLKKIVHLGLTNLQNLKVSGGGSLRNMSILARLTKLEDLSILVFENRYLVREERYPDPYLLSNLPSLAVLTNLTGLHLPSEYLFDSMITEISTLQNLRLLDFRSLTYPVCFILSEIKETFWTSLHLLTNLRTICLPKPYQQRGNQPYTQEERNQLISQLKSKIGFRDLQIIFHES